MAFAKDLLKDKKAIFSISPGAKVFDAMKLLAEKNIGALLVMEGDKVAGIISERDIVRKVDLLGRSCVDTQVRDIMTAKVLYVEASQPVEECMALMLEKRIRHLPVMEGERLLGVISVGDVLKDVIHEQKFLISQLEHYIRGQ
jgi:CBS domain-containing protein